MFVPKTGGRSTRRRPRTSSDDSVKPPKAKRQRSVLRRPGESPPDTKLGRDIARLTELTQSNGDSTHTDPVTDSQSAPQTAKQSNAIGDNEGTVVLVCGFYVLARLLNSNFSMLTCGTRQSSTDFYTVVQLPALPDQIRGLHSGTCSLVQLFLSSQELLTL